MSRLDVANEKQQKAGGAEELVSEAAKALRDCVFAGDRGQSAALPPGPDSAGCQPLELKMAFGIPQHHSITKAGMPEIGAAGSEVRHGNINQDLSSSTRNLATHHFDSNQIRGSAAYARSSREYTRRLLADPATAPYSYAEFGRRLHTLQDFYAHSNYVESRLKANPRVGPRGIPLVSWPNIEAGGGGVRSGYSIMDETTQLVSRDTVINTLNSAGRRIPGTQYMPSEQYDRLSSFPDRVNYATDRRYSVLHRDIAKDDSGSHQGRVVNPFTGASLYDYARDLATRETARQWREFESDMAGAQRGKGRRVQEQAPEKPARYRERATASPQVDPVSQAFSDLGKGLGLY
jgi:hypothetical protein